MTEPTKVDDLVERINCDVIAIGDDKLLRDLAIIVMSEQTGSRWMMSTAEAALKEILQLRAQLAEAEAKIENYRKSVGAYRETIETQKSSLARARKALEEIANHPEKETRPNGSSYAVGWAFWNVKQIARAALQPDGEKA